MIRYIVITKLALFSLIIGLCSACNQDQGEPTEFVEYGWIEPVAITAQGIILYAKLDTGADNCSINAYDIETYKRGKKRWVKFKITTRQGEEHTFDLPVLRMARIKRIGGTYQVRPVVRLFVCLGGQYMSVDVNLVNRENFAYPMLIGRSFLQGHAMVNPAKSFTSNPQCVIPEEQ